MISKQNTCYNQTMNFQKLDQLKTKLDIHRPLDNSIVKNLREDLILRWTYNSNAIEGNTLTLNETKVALEGITVGGKSLREHFEAINHKEAILFVESLVEKDEVLSEYTIKSLHALILKNVDDSNAGSYRNVNVLISGATHRPPTNIEVPSQMEAFITWYKNEAQTLHPIERACHVHVDFVGIHPFIDGNGRISRLLMNFELMKSGFPPVVLKVENRLAYYDALDKAHTLGDYEPFTTLVEESFEPYWYVLGV
ncbi:MAG: Cell filamentation protein Fic [uncultured Sulfurovum sp.]|uniref:Cell filamentation protein Fic n=1 Tax=uncultured Sulfurovum sp. TaxID=269237 RepID=A0A6S6SHR1_9BACT|nr:MAG: Cell filamentation protein Fic [uncultured Sulfurovum sp.]